MSLQVFYTPRSKESLESVYKFILDRFGERSASKFVSKADKTINLISQQPFMFKTSDLDEKIRIALITPQCSLFYKVTETSVHLLFFWDNRQDPILI
ncbi:type II toxin-antitoxin system RelE/ParE family toxin [Daejeonella sp.]|uniref:type II toxin-antitoxin system RelE/ParE family toxin n=1 Tax=Daejeonella sp. TaxID=2805397 RepID=UPI0035203FC6